MLIFKEGGGEMALQSFSLTNLVWKLTMFKKEIDNTSVSIIIFFKVKGLTWIYRGGDALQSYWTSR